MQFNEILRELRLAKGKTQNHVAEYLGVDRTTYGKYESGSSLPDLEKLLKLSSYFDVSTDYLLGKSKLKTSSNRIAEVLEDDPELSLFWNTLKEREDLQLLFKQTRNMSPKSIKQVIRIIKAIEDEEDREDG